MKTTKLNRNHTLARMYGACFPVMRRGRIYTYRNGDYDRRRYRAEGIALAARAFGVGIESGGYDFHGYGLVPCAVEGRREDYLAKIINAEMRNSTDGGLFLYVASNDGNQSNVREANYQIDRAAGILKGILAVLKRMGYRAVEDGWGQVSPLHQYRTYRVERAA